MESEQPKTNLTNKCINNLIAFVKNFVIYGDQMISNNYEILVSDHIEPSEKTKQVMEVVTTGIEITGTVVENLELIPMANVLGSNSDKIANVVRQIVYGIEKIDKKRKAKNLAFLSNQYNENIISLRVHFLRTAIQLFLHYEYQFMQIKKNRSEEIAIKEIAQLSVKRLFNYFKDNPSANEEIENVPAKDLFFKLIVFQELTFAKPVLKKYKYDVKDNKNETYKINKFFSKPGIKTGDKYYIKKGKSTEWKKKYSHYGYRLKFDWDKLEDYEKDNSEKTYQYLLSDDIIKGLKEQFDDIIFYDVHLSPPLVFELKKADETKIQRQYLIDQIEAKIDQEIVVLTGLPGVGKTILAQQYACKKYKENRYTYNIIWISENTQFSFEKLYRDLQLNLTAENAGTKTDEKEPIDTIVNAVFDLLKSKPTLFIFDNVDNFDALKRYIPPSTLPMESLDNLKFLVTSINSEWKNLTPKIHVINIDSFSFDEAKQFVENRLNKNEQPVSDSTIEKLIKLVNCFPLVLAQIVEYINQENIFAANEGQQNLEYDIENTINRYEKSAKDLLTHEEFLKLNDYSKSTFNSMQIVLKKFEGDHDLLKFLNLLAYFANDHISASYFHEEFPSSTTSHYLGSMIEKAKAYSIIQVIGNDNKKFLSMHSVFQKVLQIINVDNEQETLKKALEILRKYLLKPTSEDVEQGWIDISSLWKYAYKHEDLIKAFIINDEDNFHMTHLQIIARYNELEILENVMKCLKEKRKEKFDEAVKLENFNRRTLLHMAVLSSDFNKVKYLIDEGSVVIDMAKFKKNSFLPHMNNNVEILKRLLNNEELIGQKTEQKCTLHYLSHMLHHIIYMYIFHFAALNGNVELLKYIIESKKININHVEIQGFTALHFAVIQQHFDAVKFLLSQKIIDVNVSTNGLILHENDKMIKKYYRSHEKMTPLHYAAQNESADIFKLLLNHSRIRVNVSNKDGFTPLHYAAMSRNEGLPELLKNETLDLNLKTTDNKTALDIINERVVNDDRYKPIVDLLTDKSKKNNSQKNL